MAEALSRGCQNRWTIGRDLNRIAEGKETSSKGQIHVAEKIVLRPPQSLEAVLRQIPLKRRFMKNYKVVRNLVANPRTPLDLGLGLMKNLLVADLKNLSANKEVSETIRKLAMKMFKQKLDAAAKK